MRREFVPEKETKNTWRFQEDTTEQMAIGPLYVQKAALDAIGWQPGTTLVVQLSVGTKI